MPTELGFLGETMATGDAFNDGQHRWMHRNPFEDPVSRQQIVDGTQARSHRLTVQSDRFPVPVELSGIAETPAGAGMHHGMLADGLWASRIPDLVCRNHIGREIHDGYPGIVAFQRSRVQQQQVVEVDQHPVVQMAVDEKTMLALGYEPVERLTALYPAASRTRPHLSQVIVRDPVTQQEAAGHGAHAPATGQRSQKRQILVRQLIDAVGVSHMPDPVLEQPAVVVAGYGDDIRLTKQIAGLIDTSPAVCQITGADQRIESLAGKPLEHPGKTLVLTVEIANDPKPFDHGAGTLFD